MKPEIPKQLQHGIGRTRTALIANQAEIEACVSDMAKSAEVDLTDELERLTAVGDTLRKRLETYENAAAIAIEHGSHIEADERVNRDAQRAQQVRESARRRVAIAREVVASLGRAGELIAAFDVLDEETHAALYRLCGSGTGDGRMHIVDGRARQPLFDSIREAIKKHAHDQPAVDACTWKQQHINTLTAPFISQAQGEAQPSVQEIDHGN